MNFKTTANSADIFRHRTSAEVATMNSSSVSDSFAEASKNAIMIHGVRAVMPISLVFPAPLQKISLD